MTEAAERAARGSTLDTRSLSLIERTIRAGVAGRRALAARDDLPALQELIAGIDVSLLSVAEEIGRAVEEDGSDLQGLGLAGAAPPASRAARGPREAGRAAAQDRARPRARRAPAGRLRHRARRPPVLALKASARGRVPGIVHDSSGSGQTLFVEPLAAVEDSNRLREAEVAERDEVARILRNLSSLVAGQAEELITLVEATAELDLVLARGTLSRGWRGALVTPSHEVVLRGARHPLLDRASAVPIDLELGSLRALVISGPNTGGKTVALKTLGLAAALHQCGLRPPADEAALPVFDEILVDIGDEQSIAMSLSTFSAHLRNLVGILERATSRVARAPRRDRRRHRSGRGRGAGRGPARPPRDAGAAHRDDEPLRGAEGVGERCRRRRQRRHGDRSRDERAALHASRSAGPAPRTRCRRPSGSACPRRSSRRRGTASHRSGCRWPSSSRRPRRRRGRPTSSLTAAEERREAEAARLKAQRAAEGLQDEIEQVRVVGGGRAAARAGAGRGGARGRPGRARGAAGRDPRGAEARARARPRGDAGGAEEGAAARPAARGRLRSRRARPPLALAARRAAAGDGAARGGDPVVAADLGVRGTIARDRRRRGDRARPRRPPHPRAARPASSRPRRDGVGPAAPSPP